MPLIAFDIRLHGLTFHLRFETALEECLSVLLLPFIPFSENTSMCDHAVQSSWMRPALVWKKKQRRLSVVACRRFFKVSWMYSLIFSKRFIQVGVAADPESIPGTLKREYTLNLSQDLVYKHTWLKYTKIPYNNMKVVTCSFLLCCLWAWPFHDAGNRHLFRLWSFSPSLAVGLVKHASCSGCLAPISASIPGLFFFKMSRYERLVYGI